MTTLGLVACVKTKQAFAAPVATLYVSALFRKSLLAALDRCKDVRILSAKHGLLSLGELVEPYEQTLKTLSPSDRRRWGEDVGKHLQRWVHRQDVVLLFAGEAYVAPITPALQAIGCEVERPLGSRSMGARLQALRVANDESALAVMLSRFDRLMRRLARAQAGGRLIARASGRQAWPERGLYLITEPTGPIGRDWITRVGTHAVSAGSRTTLWSRLSTHKGPEHGGGSHRSSIFRSHVGHALIRRGDVTPAPTWGLGQSAPAQTRHAEVELERHVSDAIGDMRLLWLDVPDAAGPGSDRAYLERNVIGLLSRANLLGLRQAPNKTWLGHHSAEWRIAASGLWNLNHLFHKPDPCFLDVLETYVTAVAGGERPEPISLAPTGWRQNRAEPNMLPQLELFDDEGGPSNAA